MSDFFNEAFRLARSRYNSEQWLALTPQQVTQAIYQAMRDIDAAAAGKAAPETGSKPGKPRRPEESAQP